MSNQAARHNPLHLLIVSNTEATTHIRGADRDWVNLLNALGPERLRVTWVGAGGGATLRKYLHPRVNVRIVDVEFEPFGELFHDQMYRRRTILNWAGIVKASVKALRRPLRALTSAIDKDYPDLVISNTSVVGVGAAYAFRRRLPHIWCVKEFLDPEVRACRNYAWLMEQFSDAIVVPSQAMATPFSNRVRVLHDGSDVTAIRAGVRRPRCEVLKSLGLPVQHPLVVQLGGVTRAKGQHITVQAVTRLAEAGHDPISLLFLGTAGAEQRRDLTAMLGASSGTFQANLRFAEFPEDDFSCLAAADLVVHPSVLPDPYPNAVREALALGKPVIGSRTGGIPELIHDGKTGLLVESNNPVQLAAALERLLEAPELRAAMAEAAKAFASRYLDVNVRKQAFYDLLMELKDQKRSLRHGIRASNTAS